jgi:hypothetical protein
MEQITRADIAAFDGGGSAMANAIIEDAGVRIDGDRRRGRGAGVNPSGRFEPLTRHVFDDGWETLEELPPFKTEVQVEKPRTIITRNTSPDISFDRSINPYRGCEHGCVYCFARPTHEYLGLNAGLDFETKIYVKHRAPELFREWLGRDGWRPEPICFSGVTDCYQPAERRYRLTRGCLEVALEARQPVSIVTKNALVTRDLDLLGVMDQCHCIERRAEHEHLAAGLGQLAEWRVVAIAVIERVVRGEPIGLRPDGGNRCTGIGAAYGTGCRAQEFGENAMVAHGA